MDSARRFVQALSSATLDDASVPRNAPAWHSDLVTVLAEATETLSTFSHAPEAWGTQQVDILLEGLADEVDRLLLRAATASGSLHPDLGAIVAQLHARRATEVAAEAVNTAEQALTDARRAHGATAEGNLAQHFNRLAKREQRLAYALRACAAFLVVAIAAFAYLSELPSETLTDGLVHLAVVIPVGVLAAYSARLAEGHVHVARWADTLEVQLLSLDGFIAELGSDEAAALRVELGRRVFLESPAPHPGERLPSASNDLVQLAQTLADMVGTLSTRRAANEVRSTE